MIENELWNLESFFGKLNNCLNEVVQLLLGPALSQEDFVLKNEYSFKNCYFFRCEKTVMLNSSIMPVVRDQLIEGLHLRYLLDMQGNCSVHFELLLEFQSLVVCSCEIRIPQGKI